jgi:cyclopropane fatty-acyl-phospholipid synthase-like methyltransferase
MISSFGGAVAIPIALLLFAAPDVDAQKYTDPDTLAPAFPTPQVVVDHMLQLAQVKPNETVYDLGCGDGRIVITAAQKFRAHGVGIEIRREIYETTLGKVSSLGLSDLVKIVHGNALKYNERLKPVLERYLKTTARVVSHNFEIKGWKVAQVEKMMVDDRPHMIYLYRLDSK